MRILVNDPTERTAWLGEDEPKSVRHERRGAGLRPPRPQWLSCRYWSRSRATTLPKTVTQSAGIGA